MLHFYLPNSKKKHKTNNTLNSITSLGDYFLSICRNQIVPDVDKSIELFEYYSPKEILIEDFLEQNILPRALQIPDIWRFISNKEDITFTIYNPASFLNSAYRETIEKKFPHLHSKIQQHLKILKDDAETRNNYPANKRQLFFGEMIHLSLRSKFRNVLVKFLKPILPPFLYTTIKSVLKIFNNLNSIIFK